MMICFMNTKHENVIARYMREKGITKVWLAEQFGVTSQTIGERLAKVDMETSFIKRCSELMNHNFFEDLAGELKIHNKPNMPKPYKVLEQENSAMQNVIGAIVEERLTEYLNKRDELILRGKIKKKK